MLEIVQIPVLFDNYIYLAHDAGSGATAAIDPALAEPVLDALHARGWQLTHILNTHHHIDHIGGNIELKQATGCIIVGYGEDAARISGIDVQLKDGDVFMLGSARADVLFVPGHTRGHITYWFADEHVLFCGDTLFSMGCGRLFEGTPEQMYASLSRIAALPEDTLVYCTHEYTESNGRFALTLEPGNGDLQTRMAEVRGLRAEGRPTVPSTLGVEKRTNPFLRTESVEIRKNLGMLNAAPVQVFTEIRHRKDRFQ
ncbi:MAG: hydroxyacylglutathione hydrolase [Alphaproteobacteria bacterium]|nr:hydroxyacylglutathione hydrolase [Alphaproteobacteria bacterium]